MTRSLFRYIWRHSRRDQLVIFAVVLASLPFYYLSLDLPRKIVNEAIQGRAFEEGRMTAPFLDLTLHWPAWLGGDHKLFGGFEVGRLELLFGLSTVFLALVLVNGLFKYWINVAKGALGERMMRRLRFELFTYALRFTPEALRNIRSAEAATIIKDEVEPIGGFIGDAYIQPVLLGTQALTALAFILMQSVWLGVLAGGVVGIQFTIIPRMRRELLRLGRQRQLASREFAGRVSEVIDGMEAVQVHDSGAWERAEIGGRLHTLFDIRFKIYKRKFIVKFLNNLLAQMTPFFFYAVGGYFALSGKLDIGQLVAVIAAYRELPPPLKELIDWDQQRLDVQVKYDQVVGYFAPDKLVPVRDDDGEEDDDPSLAGRLRIAGLHVLDGHGLPLIDGGEAAVSLPARVAVLSDGSAAAGVLARILARREGNYTGEVTISDVDLSSFGPRTAGRRIAYAGTDPVLFPGSIRDNLTYSLRSHPFGTLPDDEEERRRLDEAARTGNPLETALTDWTDCRQAGVASSGELDALLVRLLTRIGLGDDVYRFGLAGMIDPVRQPALAEQIVEARRRLQQLLDEEGMADMVEPFDPARYNDHATVAENLLFGVPTSKGLIGPALVDHPDIRSVLDKTHLTEDLVRMGVSIAETMTDIFQGLPPGHPLFEQFSFVHADELAEFEQIVKRSHVKGRGGLTRDDRHRLLALPLDYIEPRHRLGLLDDTLRGRMLEARSAVHDRMDGRADPGVEFYHPEGITLAAPLRDNLLFGRVNETIANARDRIREMGGRVIAEMELTDEIERVGLDHGVGPAGRRLTPQQRAAVNLIRCLVKRPDLMVVDGALAPFGDRHIPEVLAFLGEETEGRSLLVVLPNDRHLPLFDEAIGFRNREVVPVSTEGPPPVAEDGGPPPDLAGPSDDDPSHDTSDEPSVREAAE